MEIVDREGLDALSIRKLGEAMNVNGASLYHHFKDKNDILVGVTQLALADVISPRSQSDNWRVWLPMNAYRTRQALIAHPELIPIMLRRAPLGIGSQEVEASIKRLEEEGVPIEAITPLMESLELLAIVSALQAVGTDSAWRLHEPDKGGDSALSRAQSARGISSDELFGILSSSVVTAVETAVHLKKMQNAADERTE